MPMKNITSALALMALNAGVAFALPEEDLRTIAALDTAYQEAVERNDSESMAAILHEDMVVVLGNGLVRTREELLESARTGAIAYEHQVEEEGTQHVRLYGPDTAVVTARLWAKGTRRNGSSLDVRLWFTDVYVRTPQGWRYAFGQASSAEPSRR